MGGFYKRIVLIDLSVLGLSQLLVIIFDTEWCSLALPNLTVLRLPGRLKVKGGIGELQKYTIDPQFTNKLGTRHAYPVAGLLLKVARF